MLYGTAHDGGANNMGAVYKAGYDSMAHIIYSVLHSFTGTDGSHPTSGLWGPPNSTSTGNATMYGVTFDGGSHSSGTIFQIGAGSGVAFSSLYSFTGGTDGSHPTSVTSDGAGALYITCANGGASSGGTICKYTVSTGVLTVLHAMSSATDGANPAGLLLADNLLFGTAPNGGPGGAGTVFKLTPSGGSFTTMRSFSGTSGDGGNPACQLVKEPGTTTLLGTTANGGSQNYGTIFTITEAGAYTQQCSITVGTAPGVYGIHPSGGFTNLPATMSSGSFYYFSCNASVDVSSGTWNGGQVDYYTGSGSTYSAAYSYWSTTSTYVGNSLQGPPTALPSMQTATSSGPTFYFQPSYYGGGTGFNDGVLFLGVSIPAPGPAAFHTFGP